MKNLREATLPAAAEVAAVKGMDTTPDEAFKGAASD